MDRKSSAPETLHGVLPIAVTRYKAGDREQATSAIAGDGAAIVRRSVPAAVRPSHDDHAAPPTPSTTADLLDPRVSPPEAVASSPTAPVTEPFNAIASDPGDNPATAQRRSRMPVRAIATILGLVLLASGLAYWSMRGESETTLASTPAPASADSGGAPSAPVPGWMTAQAPKARETNTATGPATSGPSMITSEALGAAGGRDLTAPSAGPEILSSRQSALVPDTMVPRQEPPAPAAPMPVAGPVSTRIAQLTCDGHQPILLSVAIYNDARAFDGAVPSFKDWTGRQNGVVLFDTRSRPDPVRLADAAKAQNLVVMAYSDPDTRVEKIDDEAAMSWFVFSEADAGSVAARNCVVRLFVR
jgi:hypothetical protein